MADIFVAPKIKDSMIKSTLASENHMHTLTSFCQNPTNISFENQEHDEKILLILRAHFITNTSWILTSFFLIIIPPVLNMVSSELHIFPFSLSGNLSFVLFAFYYILVFIFIFINFMTWFYNITFVTNKRIVDVDFSNIVHHDIAATKLNLIEDVKYVQIGFLRSLFNYGNVFMQTAGEKENFEAIAVPKPALAIQIIGNLIGGRQHAH